MPTVTNEEFITAIERILTRLSVVDAEALTTSEMMAVSLSEDVGLGHADFNELSEALAEEGIDIEAERLEELDTIEAIWRDLSYGHD